MILWHFTRCSYIPSKSILWVEVARLRYALCGILEIHACSDPSPYLSRIQLYFGNMKYL